MSLLLWFPLNGDFTNNGVAGDVTFSGSPTWADGGKFGKCLAVDHASHAVTIPEIQDVDEFTICYWVKVDSSAAYAEYVDIWSISAKTGQTLSTIRCELGSSSTPGYITQLVAKDTTVGSNTNNYRSLGQQDASIDKWCHMTLVKDSAKVKQYVNGVFVNEVACSSFENEPQYINGQLRFGQNASNPSFVNDWRFYDEALSPRQIKEIAKGLVVHYPLSCPGGENLARNTASYTGWGKSNGTNTSGNVVTFPTVTANTWREIYPNTLLPYSNIRNKTITQSCYVKADSGVSCRLNMCIGVTASETSTTRLKYRNISKDFTGTGKWQKITDTRTVTDDMFTSGTGTPDFSTCYFTPRLGAWNSYWNGFQMKDYKVEVSDHATPWCPNPADAEYTAMGFGDGNEYDTSGFGYNGTMTGTILWSPDTPKYNGCYVFNGSSYIRLIPELYHKLRLSREELTVSIWAYKENWNDYPNDGDSQWQTMFSCQQSGGFTIYEKRNGQISFVVGTGDSTNSYKTTSQPVGYAGTLTGWHMFTLTYDGYAVRRYVDGVLTGTAANPYDVKTPAYYYSGNISVYVGAEAQANLDVNALWNGKLSDFRIYETALSDADIIELYNTGASITSNGVLMANEFVEGA